MIRLYVMAGRAMTKRVKDTNVIVSFCCVQWLVTTAIDESFVSEFTLL